MIDPRTIESIQRVSVEERLHIIELILESLKRDMRTHTDKQFVIRQFSLGQEVQVDRYELYAERASNHVRD